MLSFNSVEVNSFDDNNNILRQVVFDFLSNTINTYYVRLFQIQLMSQFYSCDFRAWSYMFHDNEGARFEYEIEHPHGVKK